MEKLEIKGKTIECRFLGGRQSNISESENFLKSIKDIRQSYDIPSPPLCKIHIDGSDLIIHVNEDEQNALHSKIIKNISIEGNSQILMNVVFTIMFTLADLCGLLVDKGTNAEVWLLQGLDLRSRLSELSSN